MELEDKKKALEEIRKNYPNLKPGKDVPETLTVIPTGSLSLDLATGVGGYPRGCLVDIFGRESSGKSLLSLLAIRETQKLGGLAIVIDAERNYSKSRHWMKLHGIKVEDVEFHEPATGEEAFDLIYDVAKANAADLIVIDSNTALRPQANLSRDLEQGPKIGALALMMSIGLNKITPTIDDSKIVCIFINQLREIIDLTRGMGVLASEADKATGGRGLKFYASLRIGVKKISNSEILNDQKEIIGHRIRAKIFKNKVAPPLKLAEFDLYYNKGVDNDSELFDVGLSLGSIKNEGHTYFIGDKRAVGLAKCKSLIKEDLDVKKFLTEEIEKRIRRD